MAEKPEILDPSKPDPVVDDDSGYLGRVPWGFSNNAELLNGRAAMMGFSVAYLQEAIVGKGVLEQYGLPYDEGAVLTNGGGNIVFSLLGLVAAVVIVTGLSYAGEFVNNNIF